MEDRSFYVYAHYRLDTMEPFYIGKGKDGRKDKLSRNTIHDRISKKHGHAVVILYDNLTEEEAFFYEREVIEDLVFDEGYEIPCKNCGEFTGKFSYLTNFSFGGEGTSGYKFTKEQSKNCSKGQKKRYESEDERRLSSDAIKKHFKDNPNSSKLISEKAKERYENEDERAKLGKKCYCKELNLYFPYALKAIKILKELGMPGAETIKYACNGTYSYAGTLKNGTKLTWKYIDEDNECEMIKYNEFIKNSEEYYNNLKESKIEFMKTNEIISNNSSGTNNGRAMSCYCNELKICFSYVNLGKKYCRNILGIKIGYIPGVCYGNKKYSGIYNGTKLTWNWLEDVDEETLKNATYIDDEKYNELISKNVNDCK